jgi:hypothetical protein
MVVRGDGQWADEKKKKHLSLESSTEAEKGK